MSGRVAVVGASGRVGSAICDHLDQEGHDVVHVARTPGESLDRLVARAVDGVDVVVNAAGVAHIERPTPDDLGRLEAANVELPVALAAAALERGIPFIHISSVKAADPKATSAYAQSKRRGDERLEGDFGQQFAEEGLALVIVRPLALLFPPLDVGKVARLRFLRWWPQVFTPPLRVPVLAPARFLVSVDALVSGALARVLPPGNSVRVYEECESGTLRDVALALKDEQERSDRLG